MYSNRVRKLIQIGSILSLLILIGCGTKKTVLYKPLPEEVASYQVIVIPNFSESEEYWVPLDSVSEIPDMVAEKLRVSNHFVEISRTETNSTSGGRALLVKGTVTDYDPGCKLREWWSLGINDWGKSKLYVRVKLIDKTTGEVIADGEMQGRAKEPGTGASRYTRVVDEIVRFIQSVNSESS